MPDEASVFLLLFVLISAIGAILTVYDKAAARRSSRRVPEATLMLFAVLGGALIMYIVMRVIRHKTRKSKFSVGLPIMIVLQTALLTALHIWLY